MKKENVAGLLFNVAAEIDRYVKGAGVIQYTYTDQEGNKITKSDILPLCKADYELMEYRDKFNKYNRKFIEEGKLNPEEIEWLREIPPKIKELYSQRFYGE
jgi:hypothetical protein